jgi:hypothetical protein
MLIDISRFVEIFLTGENLQNVICHLCNQNSGHISDPITETLTTIATTPISVIITEAGIAMFRNKPTMVIPYTNMSAVQLSHVKEVVDSFVQDSPENRLQVKGNVQMGGGCIIMISSKTKGQEVLIDKNEILQAFILGVYNSKNYNNWTKKALCNIIMQRLSCTMTISRDVLQYAIAYCDEKFKESSSEENTE